MSDPKYLQDGFDKRLSHLLEECGEVIAAGAKLQRWGAESENPDLKPGDPHYGESNLSWLQREMLDVEECITRLRESIFKEKFK